jgi:hypothetical protein
MTLHPAVSFKYLNIPLNAIGESHEAYTEYGNETIQSEYSDVKKKRKACD